MFSGACEINQFALIWLLTILSQKGIYIRVYELAFILHYWKSNFPMTPYVRRVGWLVVWSVCHYFTYAPTGALVILKQDAIAKRDVICLSFVKIFGNSRKSAYVSYVFKI